MDTYNTVSYYYTRFYHVLIFELFVLLLIEIRVNLYLKNKWYHIIVKKVKIYYKKKKNILVLYLHKRNIFLSIYNIVPPTIVQYNWSSTHVY